MNIQIISDIHGSAQRLEDALSLDTPIDLLVLVGDLLYHGPRNPILDDYDPQKVAAILNQYPQKIIAVRGNCDAEVDQLLIDFPIMQDYTTLITPHHHVYITHGHLHDPDDFAPKTRADIFISGHTHLPVLEQKQAVWMFNPGSIASPKGNHPPTYGLLSDHELSIRTLDHQLYQSTMI